MKRFIALLAIAVFLVACGLFDPIPLPEDFCDDKGDRSESWLLEMSGKLVKDDKMTNEEMLSTVYYSMIRASALGQLIAKDREFIEHWWREVGEFYIEMAPDITWNDLIDYMFDEEEWGENIRLVKIIVIPNAQSFRSFAKIKDWDHCALTSGHKYVGEIFGWDPIAARIDWDDKAFRAGYKYLKVLLELN